MASPTATSCMSDGDAAHGVRLFLDMETANLLGAAGL
jgi:hypothetical protein